MSYPTWTPGDQADTWVSREQLDGTPDFIIKRIANSFWLKSRTSAHPTWHESLAEAKLYVERSFPPAWITQHSAS